MTKLTFVEEKFIENIGDREARACIQRTGCAVEDIRLGDLSLIRHAFDECMKSGEIPVNTPFRPFKKGWKGNAVFYEHGRPSSYVSGCRCGTCREGWRLYNKQNREANQEKLRRALIEKVNTPYIEQMARLAELRELLKYSDWRLSAGIEGAD